MAWCSENSTRTNLPLPLQDTNNEAGSSKENEDSSSTEDT